MNNSQKIKQVYDEWSGTYDEHAVFNIAITKIHPVILELIKDEPNKDLGLDLGCGTGIMTIAASEFAKEITGIDYSDGMLDKAKKKQSLGAKLNFIKHDLHEKLPFDDESFNFAISVLTLHHLDSLQSLYSEISRVLKPGGFYIFDEFVNNNQTKEQLTHPFSVNYYEVLGEAKKQGVNIWQIRDLSEHKTMLEKAGLKIEKIIEIKCDDAIKRYVVNYKYHEGRVIAKVVLARKK